MWSELRKLAPNSSNVVIQKNCLQLGNLGLNWSQICPKNYEWQKFCKNKCQSRDKHVAMYPDTKFQLTWRTSDFGTKFAPKNMSEKKLKKLTLNSKQG